MFIIINYFSESPIVMYMQIVLGFGCVLAAAAMAIYFSIPTPAAPQRRRNNNGYRNDNNDDDDDDNDDNNVSINGLHRNKPKSFRQK